MDYLDKRCAAVIGELRTLRGAESAAHAACLLEEDRRRSSEPDDDEGERAAQLLVSVIADEDEEVRQQILRVHCPVLEDRVPMLLSTARMKRQGQRRAWSLLDGVNILSIAALVCFGDSGLLIVALAAATLLLFLLPRWWTPGRAAPLLFIDAHLAVAWQNLGPWMTWISLAASFANALVFFLGPTEDKKDARC